MREVEVPPNQISLQFRQTVDRMKGEKFKFLLMFQISLQFRQTVDRIDEEGMNNLSCILHRQRGRNGEN